MKIDHMKLAGIIERLAMETVGPCSETKVVIGETGGKQIQWD